MNTNLSMLVFAAYLIVGVGVGLNVTPDFILGILGLPAGDGVWIRTVGLLAAIIGIYYVLAVRAGCIEIIRWSVGVRLFAAAFMGGLFLSGLLGPGILLLAAVDLAAAFWTWMSLRAERGAGPQAG